MDVVTPHRPRRPSWPRIAVCVATHDNRTLTVQYRGGTEHMEIKAMDERRAIKTPLRP
jgi:hypothetical protein